MKFVTGDTHFFHRNIIEYCRRPFHNVDEMNQVIVRNWNEVINTDDEVFVLGDFAFTTGHEYEIEVLFAELNGIKTLVKGNHDKGLVLNLPWHMVLQDPIELVEEGVLLTHDYKGYDGDWHDRPIFGAHVHEIWKMKGNLLNCGVDVWHFRPVNVEDAKRYWQHRYDYFVRTGRDA